MSFTTVFFFFFFFNDTAPTEIYTLSLHDALPIYSVRAHLGGLARLLDGVRGVVAPRSGNDARAPRSEEHTSELQSRPHLVCRLLLEKKKNNKQLSTHCFSINPQA